MTAGRAATRRIVSLPTWIYPALCLLARARGCVRGCGFRDAQSVGQYRFEERPSDFLIAYQVPHNRGQHRSCGPHGCRAIPKSQGTR